MSAPILDLAVKDLALRCQHRFTDFARTLSALPRSKEGAIVLSSEGQGAPVSFEILALGRGPERETVAAQSAATIQTVASSALDFAEWVRIEDKVALERTAAFLSGGEVLREVIRRTETISLKALSPAIVGLNNDVERLQGTQVFDHICRWVPSDDDWRRLFMVLSINPFPCAVIVRFRTWEKVPNHVVREGEESLRFLANHFSRDIHIAFDAVEERFKRLVAEASQRLASLRNNVLVIRVFLAGRVDGAVLATLASSIDDSSLYFGQTGSEWLARGGALSREASRDEILDPLTRPLPVHIFDPVEASAVLRTPMPQTEDLPGLPMIRSRTAPLTGREVEGTPLGTNRHRGRSREICLDQDLRSRHVYVVGQTGTGKSTLLLRMLLSDIQRGRAVILLDPHGALVDDLLERLPEQHRERLVIVDPTEEGLPQPLNFLAIRAPDSDSYRRRRDVLIDDFLGSLKDDHSRVPEAFGPVFELYYRLLMIATMGSSPPAPDQKTPSFETLVRLSTNKKARDEAMARLGKDDRLANHLQEMVEDVRGDSAFSNVAPWVFSKFGRFVTDSLLQRVFLRDGCFDFGRAVEERKILLVKLPRGRIGEHAARLIAKCVMSEVTRTVFERGARVDPPVYLYADEFQIHADQKFAELLAECRKFGMCLTLAHQFAHQLPEPVRLSVLGNVGTMVAFRVGPDDAKALEGWFSPVFVPTDLMSLPNFQAAVRSSGALGATPFSLQTHLV